jgi:hypothetical protein
MQAEKTAQGAVVGALDRVREKTSGHLLHVPVIFQAFTAPALAAAGFVGAVARLEVLIDTAFLHGFILP